MMLEDAKLFSHMQSNSSDLIDLALRGPVQNKILRCFMSLEDHPGVRIVVRKYQN